MQSQREFVDAAANPPAPAGVSVASVCFGGEPLVLNPSVNHDVLDRLCKEAAKQKTLICVQDIGIKMDPGQQYTIHNVETRARRAFEELFNARCRAKGILPMQGHMYVVASFVLSLDTDLHGNYHANAILAHNLDPKNYVNLTPGAHVDDKFRLRNTIETKIKDMVAFDKKSQRLLGRESSYAGLDPSMVFPDRWRIAAAYFPHLTLFVFSATPKDNNVFCSFTETIIWDALLSALEKVFAGSAETKFDNKQLNILFMSSAGASAPSEFKKTFPCYLKNGTWIRSDRGFRQILRSPDYKNGHPSYIFHSYYSAPAPVA